MRAIRNYTSTQDVERSIQMIEDRLRSFGAKGIYKAYADTKPGILGELAAITFNIVEPKSGQQLVIRLPANVGKVTGKLIALRKTRATAKQLQTIGHQARRTAWKLMLDWIDCQLSLVYMEQAEPAQVFLPYIVGAGGKTVYENIQAGGFKAITDQREAPPIEDAEYEVK
jgi:hypothetical protein